MDTPAAREGRPKDFIWSSGMITDERVTDDEAIQLAKESFPDRHFMILRSWVQISVMLSKPQEQALYETGLQAIVIHSANVVFDSENCVTKGTSILTGYLGTMSQRLFESKTTVFIRLGPGAVETISEQAMQAISDPQRRKAFGLDVV